ncbi:PaaI family thioesterase [Marinobacter shengliensis]|uniref:PaaI family thioesterase n=1 Tax=Marinobacter shengliensis TaxID=1389223 RepID=UPI000D0F1A50|nr:PaaI family thioesterase [Marinobacter shengliensis]PSF11436.1 PaaI family thioesterase [Marinobacter shengliensis]
MTRPNRVQQSDAVTTAWQFTEQVPHGRDLGMQVVSVDQGQVCMRLTPQSWMFAQEDTNEICTSVLYSLADSAGGLAVFAGVLELMPIATLDLRMDYLRPVSGDRALLAVATCRHLTNEVAFIHCDILSEGNRELLATANATFMRNTPGQQFRAGILKKEGA